MKKAPLFQTEADLCAAFIEWATRETGKHANRGGQVPKWTAYAETAGWDILLVAPDGTQIGIQAKLKFNMKVLHQAIPGNWDSWRDSGPDYRAILVPERDGMVNDICGALGLVVFSAGRHWDDKSYFDADLTLNSYDSWHYWSPKERHPLPEFVPDVVAGASGPVQLTKWKIAALRVVAVLQVRGHVTREDFKRFGIDPRRWHGPHGWLVPGTVPGQFMRGPSLNFDAQHPTVFAEVLDQERQRLEKSGVLL